MGAELKLKTQSQTLTKLAIKSERSSSPPRHVREDTKGLKSLPLSPIGPSTFNAGDSFDAESLLQAIQRPSKDKSRKTTKFGPSVSSSETIVSSSTTAVCTTERVQELMMSELVMVLTNELSTASDG